MKVVWKITWTDHVFIENRLRRLLWFWAITTYCGLRRLDIEFEDANREMLESKAVRN